MLQLQTGLHFLHNTLDYPLLDATAMSKKASFTAVGLTYHKSQRSDQLQMQLQVCLS